MIGSKTRRIATTLAALAAMFAAGNAMATDLEGFLFRYDFSDGTKQFISSASQTSDPINSDAGAANFVAAYGQDGVATAVHIASTAYGSERISGGATTMNGNWTLVLSLRPGSVEKGLLFSLGRANANNSKCVFLASSSTPGRIYVGTARKKGSANSYTGSVDRELAKEWELTGASADTTSGYHTIVAVHSSGGMVAVYVDGELAGSVDTTDNATGCTFGNGIQFNQAHGASTFLDANGYSQSLNNPDVAFQDVRFYSFAFTAEDAAAYAALYPTTLPGFSNLDAYAYVQSYGVNGVDTGVYMTDTDKFTADFTFTDVSYKSWLCGAGKNANKQTHAIYLNGSKRLAWTNRGEWWWSTWPSDYIAGTSIKDTRLVMTVESSLKANLTYYDTRTTKSSTATGKTATSTGPSIIPTHLFRANTMMDDDTQACKAKIYSFEVDANSSAIVPRAFFAPTTDGNGAAGFTNVVAGTFHGECLPSPSTALTFTSGVGRAEDYRYRSDKFYSRIYASSADSETGLVKFDGGEAAGTNAQFTARGRTAKIVAVPAEYYAIDRWEGDTWAIVSGYSATDAAIEVKSDTAIQLRAVFKYVRVATPALGDGVATMFSGSTTVGLSCATEGASIYYTLDGTAPTTSSTLYEGTFPFNPENMITTLKVIAVKDDWYDSEVYEVKFVNLAVAPKSAYAQSGTENLLFHLDAIENAGAGVHETAPSTWADLAGSHTVTTNGSAGFQADAWTADGSSYFLTSSTAVKDALAAKSFTLELVISHPGNQVKDSYEYWMFFGADNSHRQFVVDLREKNSKNPLVQGVQYRESAWNSRSQFSTSTITKWNTRQYITVVCDSTGATTYCNGTNQIHKTSGGSLDPSQTALSIGAVFNGGSALYDGSEICAVRMTSRVLTEDERLRNFYVDSQRFGLENAPAGYRIANGSVQVRITEGIAGFEFSTDGGTTWATGEVWADINTETTLSARVAASTDLPVTFDDLPDGATVSGNNVTFTPTKPCAITFSAAQWSNNDGTGSFDNAANWVGGVLPSSGNDFTVNISGDTVITVNETYALGVMTVNGTGNLTFAGTGGISATLLNVDSGLTVDLCGKLAVTGVAGAGNVVLMAASDTITLSSASTLTGDLTIKADSSVAVNVTAATSVRNFFVRAATNAVVTLTVSGGSFISTETIVKSGVLKQGSAAAFGTTPKVTVEDGGTFDINGLAPDRSTAFVIAGAGAGDWPWALTSSVNVTDDHNSIDIVNLADDATIGGDVQICIGVRGGVTFNSATETLPLTLNGHTLTKTGTGTLWFRRPYSTNEGTIDVQAGTLRVNGWSNANAAYAQSCVSNIVLVLRDGAAAKSELSHPLYFKTLDVRGGSLSSSTGAFGVNEEIILDPIRNPVSLKAAPAFASGARAVLTNSYADVTCGKLVLMTWSGSGTVTPPAFDASCVGGTPDGLTVETASDGTSRQLVLRVGGYEQNAKPIRIAPIGDSITQGVTKDGQGDYPQYRTTMAAHLAAHGYKPTLCGIWKYADLDKAGVPAPEEWAWHTGVSGDAIITTDKSGGVMDNLHLYLDVIGKPDVITLLIGTNDMGRNGKSAEETYANWTNLVWEIVRQRPGVKIVASTILDRKDNADGVKAKVAAFNTLLKAGMNAGNLPANLSLVDLFAAVPLATAGNFFSDGLHPNWQGHAIMAKGFADGIMSVCPCASFTPTVDDTVTDEAQSPLGASGIDELAEYRSGFRHVYTIDAAETNSFPNSGIAPYTATNAVLRSSRKLAKVGYYMELVRKGTNRRRWVWVDMDASGKTLGDVDLPWEANPDRPRQFIVEKLHVKSNDIAVHAVAPTDDTVSGVFEGSPYNYSAGGTTAQLSGAPANLMTGGYGWNDNMTGTSSGFGCFQMHRIFTAEQKAAAGVPHDAEVLFAWNRWGSNSDNPNRADDIGIGTYACHVAGVISSSREGNLDYTQTANAEGNLADTVSAKAYQVRRIEIWVVEQPPKGVMVIAY